MSYRTSPPSRNPDYEPRYAPPTTTYLSEKAGLATYPGFPAPSEGTTVTISSELFEKLTLAATDGPKNTAAPRAFGNPTPISVVGFLLSLSPLSCDLMGWRGAGGNGAASIGAFFFIGGVLMLLGGIMEWIMGNTFPFVVFASFGGFWFAYGATLLPFFNAAGAYSPDPTNPSLGAATKGFNASFGFFTAFLALLCLIYLICSLRTNIIFVVIFVGLFGGFILLTATFWLLADANSEQAVRMLWFAGASTFVSDIAGWYLLLVLLLASVDFPIQLPVGDLSSWIRGGSERQKQA